MISYLIGFSGAYTAIYARELLPEITKISGIYCGIRLIDHVYKVTGRSVIFSGLATAIDSSLLYWLGGQTGALSIISHASGYYYLGASLSLTRYSLQTGAVLSALWVATQFWGYRLICRTWAPIRHSLMDVLHQARLTLTPGGVIDEATQMPDLVRYLVDNQVAITGALREAIINFNAMQQGQEARMVVIDAVAPLRCRGMPAQDDFVPFETTSCGVCLEPFDATRLHRVLPCHHAFDASCVDPWLIQHMNCPLCRASVGIHDDRPEVM